MPEVQGILETAIYVTDLPRSVAFYRQLFGCRVLLQSDRLVALDIAQRSILLLFVQGATDEPFETPGGTVPPHRGIVGGHLAFAIAASEAAEWADRLTHEDVPIESTVDWPGGARSIYFRDPDDNLVELMTPGFWANY